MRQYSGQRGDQRHRPEPLQQRSPNVLPLERSARHGLTTIEDALLHLNTQTWMGWAWVGGVQLRTEGHPKCPQPGKNESRGGWVGGLTLLHANRTLKHLGAEGARQSFSYNKGPYRGGGGIGAKSNWLWFIWLWESWRKPLDFAW